MTATAPTGVDYKTAERVAKLHSRGADTPLAVFQLDDGSFTVAGWEDPEHFPERYRPAVFQDGKRLRYWQPAELWVTA